MSTEEVKEAAGDLNNGGGLWIRRAEGGTRSFIWRYTDAGGTRREIGLV